VTKPRILVVGGNTKNIPPWAAAAFDITLIDQHAPKTPIETPSTPARAIVIWTAAVSHQHSGQCHKIGADWGVPVLKAANGWSSAVQQAAACGAQWFVDASQRGAASVEDVAALEAVDNAWRDLAEREVAKQVALSRRLRKVQDRLDREKAANAGLRSGAEERVIAEIRRQAASVRQERRAVREIVESALTQLKEAHGRLANEVDSDE
jgi:hypothetical protein